MSTQVEEWIGVAAVAAELKISERAAWELVRRLKVPLLEPGRHVLDRARFRRSDWEAARDGALKPPAPRASKTAAVPGATAGTKKAAGTLVAEKLAKLRGA